MVKLVETFLVDGICTVHCVKNTSGWATGRKVSYFWWLYYGFLARCSSWMKKKELVPHPRAAPCGAQPGDASLMQNGAGRLSGEQEGNLQNMKFGRLSWKKGSSFEVLLTDLGSCHYKCRNLQTQIIFQLTLPSVIMPYFFFLCSTVLWPDNRPLQELRLVVQI